MSKVEVMIINRKPHKKGDLSDTGNIVADNSGSGNG